jgi:hypothetical protein
MVAPPVPQSVQLQLLYMTSVPAACHAVNGQAALGLHAIHQEVPEGSSSSSIAVRSAKSRGVSLDQHKQQQLQQPSQLYCT